MLNSSGAVELIHKIIQAAHLLTYYSLLAISLFVLFCKKLHILYFNLKKEIQKR